MYLFWHIAIVVVCGFQVARYISRLPSGFLPVTMYVGLGTLHGLIPALTPRSWMFIGASDSDVNTAGAVAFFGIVAFSMAHHAFERRENRFSFPETTLADWVLSYHGQRILRRLFWMCLTIGVFSLLTHWIVTAGSIIDVFRAGRLANRFEGGYVAVVLRHGQNLLIIPCFLGFFLSPKHRRIGVVFSIFIACVIVLATRGSRVLPVSLVGASIIGYVFTHQLSTHRLVVVGIASMLVIGLMIGIYEARKTLAKDTLGEAAQRLVSPETYREALTRDPLNYHQVLVGIVTSFPDEQPYLNGTTYLRMLLFAVPRRYLEELKPEDTNLIVGRALTGRGTSMTTIPPTLIGDGYINLWGPPGAILMMFVYGGIFAIGLRALYGSLLLFLTIGANSIGFITESLRGQVYEIMFKVVMMLAFLFILSKLAGFTRQDALEIRYGLEE